MSAVDSPGTIRHEQGEDGDDTINMQEIYERNSFNLKEKNKQYPETNEIVNENALVCRSEGKQNFVRNCITTLLDLTHQF